MTWSRKKSEALMAQFLSSDTEVDPKERKRRRMIAAASELFLRLGYRKTAIDDVARTAGVAKGTVYLYFASKAELLLHAVMAEKAPFTDLFLDLMEDPDPRRRLHRYVSETARALHRMPLTMRLMLADSDLELALAELGPDLATAITEQQTETLEHLLAPFVQSEAAQESEGPHGDPGRAAPDDPLGAGEIRGLRPRRRPGRETPCRHGHGRALRPEIRGRATAGRHPMTTLIYGFDATEQPGVGRGRRQGSEPDRHLPGGFAGAGRLCAERGVLRALDRGRQGDAGMGGPAGRSDERDL